MLTLIFTSEIRIECNSPNKIKMERRIPLCRPLPKLSLNEMVRKNMSKSYDCCRGKWIFSYRWYILAFQIDGIFFVRDKHSTVDDVAWFWPTKTSAMFISTGITNMMRFFSMCDSTAILLDKIFKEYSNADEEYKLKNNHLKRNSIRKHWQNQKNKKPINSRAASHKQRHWQRKITTAATRTLQWEIKMAVLLFFLHTYSLTSFRRAIIYQFFRLLPCDPRAHKSLHIHQ